MTLPAATTDAVQALLTPEAVRERCSEIYALGRDDALPHFRIDEDRIDEAVTLVADETAAAYPSGRVPLHSRWRHFEIAGRDLWAEIADGADRLDDTRLARARFDLAIVSVLLDAGAGPDWGYADAELDQRFARSEGLALASLRWFAAGGLSRYGHDDPMRVDAERLQALTVSDLAGAFQVGADNPLTGLEQRVGLLNRVGDVIRRHGSVFTEGSECRPGHLFDHLQRQAVDGALPARDILIAVLRHLGDIWPHVTTIGGVRIGDIGIHSRVRRDDDTNGVVPFHKLSQWLSYSLVEPMLDAGCNVIDLDTLTGLAEYRNGGLFLDIGAIVLRNPAEAGNVHKLDSELVVEWRALTVALLDEVAARLRQRRGESASELPLGAVLQGGTWSAGRRIARELRSDGGPPLRLDSDGTVF